MNSTTIYDADNRIWSGPQSEAEISKNQNFGDFILNKLAENDAQRILQIDGDTDESLTTDEIRLRTLRCAENLIKLGSGQEKRIAIIARNHHNLTPLLFAALCVGSPITPIDVVCVKDGASHILQRVEPAFIFCDADVLLMVKQITNDIGLTVKLFSVRGSIYGFDSLESLMKTTGNENSFVCSKIEDSYSHAAVIACSSGTTGLPKSVCISHAMLTHVYSSGTYNIPIIMLCFSSLYWFSGVLITLSVPFGPTRVFTSQPFSTNLFFDLVEKYKIEQFVGPSSQMQAIVKSERCKTADLSSFLLCYLVGGYIPSILVQNLKELVPQCTFMTTYGLTEIGGGGTITLPNELEEHPNSVGGLVPGIQMKIISENTHEKCGIGESGEIYLKVVIPSMGYFRDEIANQNSFDKDGYLITGDIGYFDESGRLYISGRKKEIFKNRGYAIWPKELEDCIQKSQAVRYVSVVSVYDDEIMSDLPAAVIVKNDKHNITQEEIYAFVAGQFASYKWLDGGVYFVDELPMTPSGKIIQSKVKQMAQIFFQSKKGTRTIAKL